MMLRDYQTTLSQTTQQKFNKIIERYVELRLSEYSSLKDKLPRLFDIVSLGESLLLKVVELLKESNSQYKEEKQVIIGIEKNDNVYFSRLTKLLIETGLFIIFLIFLMVMGVLMKDIYLIMLY